MNKSVTLMAILASIPICFASYCVGNMIPIAVGIPVVIIWAIVQSKQETNHKDFIDKHK